MKQYPITCEISGPTAMWTRPETGTAAVSYPASSFATVDPLQAVLALWLEHSFGIFQSGTEELTTIRIRFSRESARYVKESRWHHSQQLTPKIDGSPVAEFRLTDTQEIKRWIMSFGPSATVLEPQELVAEINSELQQMMCRYGEISQASQRQ